MSLRAAADTNANGTYIPSSTIIVWKIEHLGEALNRQSLVPHLERIKCCKQPIADSQGWSRIRDDYPRKEGAFLANIDLLQVRARSLSAVLEIAYSFVAYAPVPIYLAV
jgi:hypothetical protein